MPVLAALIVGWFTRFFLFLVAQIAFNWAIRITIVSSVAAVYISLVALFNTTISPLISSLFSTGYGTVIGLAFPPIAGTVVTSLALLWAVKIGYSYLERMASVLVR
jgi:hypothetical protein